MGRLRVIDPNVGNYNYDCDDCRDTGLVFDEETKRNRPCPSCYLGKGTY